MCKKSCIFAADYVRTCYARSKKDTKIFYDTMKFNFLRTIVVLTLSSSLLLGCKSKIDLDNIDPTAEVQMGVAIPVATANATLGDFFGDDKMVEEIQVGTGPKIDGGNGVDKGVLFYRFLKTNDKNYHPIDLKSYMQNVSQEFKISDVYSGTSIPAGTEVTLTFPLEMTLTGINNNLTEERLDKMTISAANFISNISLKNLSITKDDIQKVEIVLPGSNRNESLAPSARTQGFFEKQGNTPKSADYTFEVTGFKTQGFNADIPIQIDNFDIYLMKVIKDTYASQADANENSVNKLAFDFKFHLKPTSNITISSTSAFQYQFTIDFLEYKALYGFFKPSKFMIDNETDTIEKEWAAWKSLKNVQLALAKPRIDLDITCAVAAPLTVKLNSIYVENATTGERKDATFDEAGERKNRYFDFYNVLPVTSPLEDSITNSFYLSEQWEYGKLDRLFLIRPDYVHWDYELMIRNDGEKVQHRLTDNTIIHTDITTTVPFQFMEGMKVDYSDTTSINWAGVSLDSLTAKTDYIDSIGASNVKLRLKIDNTIPLDIRLKFAFLDDSGTPIDLSGLEITEEGKSATDSVYIKAAENVETGGNVSIVNGQQVPTSTMVWMNLSAEQFNKITQATKFVYTATLNTSSQSFRDNKWVNVRNVSGLKLQLGVAASVDAFLNLDGKGNNK